jgi:nucleoside-diphosphate-sugar epimerase
VIRRRTAGSIAVPRLAFVSSALILGGTGQIGRAVARRLERDGWDVTIAARNNPPAELADLRFLRVDRSQPGELEAAAEHGVDVLVDVIPYTADDARQLVSLAGRIGSVVAVSSAAVYGWTDVPVPIPESTPTVEPGDDDYATRKRAMELELLATPELKATIVRPGAIYGEAAPHPREWFFVKRVLDGRRVVVLAHRGASRFQVTSVENLAELIALAAANPASRVLNSGDPDSPTALEIGRTISAALDHEWTEVLLPGAEQDGVGGNPWGAPEPFVLDMTEAARQLGYEPVTTYEQAVKGTVEWLVEITRGHDWREVFKAPEHLLPMFDYEAEDRFLETLRG